MASTVGIELSRAYTYTPSQVQQYLTIFSKAPLIF